MLVNKRKNKLFAFSSIVCQQAGHPGQTLRARWILPLSALERLENQPGYPRLPAFSAAKSITHSGCH
jgi:hypothetical protein